MIAVVGSRDARIGFRLAGIKKAYKSSAEVCEEKILLVEDKKDAEQKYPAGAVVVKFSFDGRVEEIPESLIKQVIGANVIIK